MKKLSLLFLLLTLSFPQISMAAANEDSSTPEPTEIEAVPVPVTPEEPKSQFNFDEDYQGEDSTFDQEKQSLVYDPLEPFNRKIFAFNEAADKYVAMPVAKTYKNYVPDRIRKSVNNFFINIESPFSVVNSLLQGDGTNAMASFSAFLINTTVGIGGLFDVAGVKKINYNKEDLGQTLGVYGLNPGPYLVIPLLGPSDLRDFSGMAAEKAIDPTAFNALKIGGKDGLANDEVLMTMGIVEVIDTREKLIEVIDNIRRDSFDIYATYRSAYLQKRQSLILNK